MRIKASREGISITIQFDESKLSHPRVRALVDVLRGWHDHGKSASATRNFQDYTRNHYRESRELRVKAISWLAKQMALPPGDPERVIPSLRQISGFTPFFYREIISFLPELWRFARADAAWKCGDGASPSKIRRSAEKELKQLIMEARDSIPVRR